MTNEITIDQRSGHITGSFLDSCRAILAFLYISLSFTNQYIRIGRIPVFIFVFLLYLAIRTWQYGFNINSELKKIDERYAFLIPFFLIWTNYSIIYALFLNNEYGWRITLYLFLNSMGFCYVLADCYSSTMIRKFFFWGMMAGLCANLLLGFWEIATGNHIMGLTEDYIRRFANTPLGFFVNANDFSTILVISIVGVIISFLQDRFIYSIGIVLLSSIVIYMVFETHSIIGISAAICMPILTFFHYNISREKKSVFAFLISFMCFLVIIFLLSFQEYYDYLKGMINEFDETTFTDRFYLYDKTWFLFEDSYYMGIGPGQNNVIGIGSVHNFLLEIISEYGFVFGSIVLLFYLMVTFKQNRKNGSLINSCVLVFCILLIPLSICSSSMTKIFPIWPILGYILSYSELTTCKKAKSVLS